MEDLFRIIAQAHVPDETVCLDQQERGHHCQQVVFTIQKKARIARATNVSEEFLFLGLSMRGM
jgi:hypothetical protein